MLNEKSYWMVCEKCGELHDSWTPQTACACGQPTDSMEQAPQYYIDICQRHTEAIERLRGTLQRLLDRN